jgi:2-keto-3-deoxy-L-rhamnonate aldolase RhmA
VSAPPSAIGGRYQAALDEGRMALGVFCAMDGYAVSHTFAASGYDFVIIDLQHAAFTWPEVENMAFRIRSTGAAVFLRTASTEPAEVNLAVDLPIDGVILPNIASFEEARAAVAQTKFPPDGERSLGNERHDTIWQAYSQPDPLVGMLVEHRGAVADIDRIFGELPIDFAWIGVHDLSASMGIDPHAVVTQGQVREFPAELTAAIDQIRAAARAHGVKFWHAERGADATITGVDARILQQAAVDALQRARDAFATSPESV